MILALEIAMLIWGIVVMVTGKLKVSKSKEVRGMAARGLAVIMLIPLPLAFGAGVIYGILNANRLRADEALGTLTAIEIVIVLGCALAAIAGGLILGKPPVTCTGGFPVQPPRQPPQGLE
jgi:hypothetical protein